MGSNREKYNFAIAILDKRPFLKGSKNYFAFDGSNTIFANCILNFLFRSLGVQGHVDATALMFSAVFRLMLVKHADDLNKSGKQKSVFGSQHFFFTGSRLWLTLKKTRLPHPRNCFYVFLPLWLPLNKCFWLPNTEKIYFDEFEYSTYVLCCI